MEKGRGADGFGECNFRRGLVDEVRKTFQQGWYAFNLHMLTID